MSKEWNFASSWSIVLVSVKWIVHLRLKCFISRTVGLTSLSLPRFKSYLFVSGKWKIMLIYMLHLWFKLDQPTVLLISNISFQFLQEMDRNQKRRLAACRTLRWNIMALTLVLVFVFRTALCRWVPSSTTKSLCPSGWKYLKLNVLNRMFNNWTKTENFWTGI
jgi:hypothetical protein